MRTSGRIRTGTALADHQHLKLARIPVRHEREPPPGVEPGRRPYEGRAASRARRRSWGTRARTWTLLGQNQTCCRVTPFPINLSESPTRVSREEFHRLRPVRRCLLNEKASNAWRALVLSRWTISAWVPQVTILPAPRLQRGANPSQLETHGRDGMNRTPDVLVPSQVPCHWATHPGGDAGSRTPSAMLARHARYPSCSSPLSARRPVQGYPRG